MKKDMPKIAALVQQGEFSKAVDALESISWGALTGEGEVAILRPAVKEFYVSL